ncbi:hypothetical protein, partial [Brevundimonas naejangsanensis]|uniref:hypothetical protein n=1 Tax=Brevundimonas naejangsanensis TaxID=588932 RepID=UPI0026EAF5E5
NGQAAARAALLRSVFEGLVDRDEPLLKDAQHPHENRDNAKGSDDDQKEQPNHIVGLPSEQKREYRQRNGCQNGSVRAQ